MLLCRTCSSVVLAVRQPAVTLVESCENVRVKSMRWTSGAPRRKPRILPIKQQKTPTMLALDHFDFYYGPMFDKRWPSIRLGLLSPNKFVAVLNRFSRDYETNERILRDSGTLNLIERLTGGTEKPSGHVEGQRKRSLRRADELVKSAQVEPEVHDDAATAVVGADGEADGLAPRAGFESLNTFGEEKTTFHMYEGPNYEKRNSKRVVRDSEFSITGLEGMGRVDLSLTPDVLYYPRELNLQVFDRGVLDDFPGPIRDSYGISSWWLLDGGSILPVLALDLNPVDRVMDMCAAPGGKSNMIIQSGRFGSLVCNDAKLSRLGQMRRGLAQYVPDNCAEASRIIIKRKDASSVETWDELDAYDKVLVDAPCSTDRLSVNQDENNLFLTANTTQRLDLPILQTRLLINALRSVRVGGSVVYATCTLSPTQNESVVENASVLADQYYGIRCVKQSLRQLADHMQSSGLYRFSQQCRHGLLVLPTIVSNFGPMYVCKLKRLR